MILKLLTRYPKKLRMKNKIILEVGKNHLGNTNLLFKYLKNFNLNEVYGFTLQLRENKFCRLIIYFMEIVLMRITFLILKY